MHLDANSSVQLKLPVDDVVIIPNRGDHSYHQGHLRPRLVNLLAKIIQSLIKNAWHEPLSTTKLTWLYQFQFLSH